MGLCSHRNPRKDRGDRYQPKRHTRKTKGLSYRQAWREAYASGQALKTPDGRYLKPVIDDPSGEMVVVYYETGRLASVSFDGEWQVVPSIHDESARANPTHTSEMEAVTSPARWGYEIVDVFYGEARPRRDQTVAIKGDLLRRKDSKAKGAQGLEELYGRKGNNLLLHKPEYGPSRGRRLEVYAVPLLAKTNRGARGGFSPKERAKLKASGFVFPERRAWPIHDLAHGKIAIQYIRMGRGRPADWAKIARAVGEKYPSLRQQALAAVASKVRANPRSEAYERKKKSRESEPVQFDAIDWRSAMPRSSEYEREIRRVNAEALHNPDLTVVYVEPHRAGFKGHKMAQAAARGRAYDPRAIERVDVTLGSDSREELMDQRAVREAALEAARLHLHSAHFTRFGQPVRGQKTAWQLRVEVTG